MTRADPTGEPSMEDILASIRKIIAEDPPGSRPASELRQQISVSPVFKPSQRELEPQAAASMAEPYLRPGSQSSPFQTVAPFPAASIPEARHQSADPFAAAVAPSQPARSLSVDDQLSELLGEVPLPEPASAPLARLVSRSISAAPGFIAKMTASTASAGTVGPDHAADANGSAVADHDAAVNVDPATHAEPPVPVKAQHDTAPAERAGFTVSRAGYIAESPADQNQRSPFDFELGPSPFAGKLYAADPVLPSPNGPAGDAALRTTPADLGSIVPTRHFDFPAGDAHKPSASFSRPVPGFEPRGQAHAAPGSFVPSFETPVAEPVAAAEPEVSEPKSAAGPALTAGATATQSESPAAPVAVAEAAAVAANPQALDVMTLETLLPPSAVSIAEAAAPVANPEPVVEIAAANAADGGTAAQQGALAAEYLAEIEAIAPQTEAIEASDPADHTEISHATMAYSGAQTGASAAFSHQQVATYAPSNGSDRSMEDTVAELLRPMLKKWLAENMPKIVERALRREIEESFALEHKPAAE